MRSTDFKITKRGETEMDDQALKIFYKVEIGKLIDETEDIDLLDLVYKIMLETIKK
jgi:hypothetical protein